MKTKQEILNWWINLGKKINNKVNDYEDFYEKIDDSLSIWEEAIDDKTRAIALKSKRWKIDIHLFFYKGECYRILY